MKKKWTHFIVLCGVVLFALYVLSLGVYLSYKATVKREARQALELPTTDLSGLSFNDYRVGEDFNMMPYSGRESVESNLFLTFENGIEQRLTDIFESGETVNSRIVKITTIIYEGNNITAYYNNIVIPNQKRLEDFFGDAYIEVSKRGNPALKVYIDQENNLQLTVEVRYNSENGYLYFEKLPQGYYDNIILENNVDGWHWSYNPIGVIWGTARKLSWGYSIFRTEDVGFTGFTNIQLLLLPLYYFLLLLPVLALVIYRNKKLQLLNILLPPAYIVWFIGMLFTTRV